MIDTTLLIDYFRKTDKSRSRLVQLSERFDQLIISTITEFKIYSGATEAPFGMICSLKLSYFLLTARQHILPLTYNEI